MGHHERRFWDAVDCVREGDARYRREAYGFVVGALGVTVAALPATRRHDPVRRHLSGRELLRGIATLAQREFGFLAPTVFSEWGVNTSEDVGRIVFQLVAIGQLSVSPEDSLDDFRGFDLAGSLADAGGPAPRRGIPPGGVSGGATDQSGSGAGPGSGSGPEPAR
jgi:uncharacterized repeat protein (TIGR04138 family)